ncbi:HNH endonuclease [Demequina maris]|uniref:HNH endonuclease n=1 Tax=Demequina maris TaxID=1638982 RepID=UPI0007814A90|nr:HNH endonuclease signature motif containing protein [Demequina maris]
MDASYLFDAGPGGAAAGFDAFGRACREARAAVGTMRGLAAVADAGASVARLGDAAQLAREVDMVLARTARDIETGSDLPGGGIAKQHGYRSAADLVAATMGTTRAEAFRLLEVGRALEEMENGGPGPDDPEDDPQPHDPAADSDDPDPDDPEDDPDDDPDDDPPPAPRPKPKPQPRYPAVATALDAGEISADCGAQIITMLDSLSRDVPAEFKQDAAAQLVERAKGLDASRFAKIVSRFKAALDVEQHERSQAQKRRRRSLRMWENREGMLVLQGELDPETAAPLRAALDKLVGDAMRASRDVPGVDLRTTEQMRADSLADLARHALGCETTTALFGTTTVVVRATATDLEKGTGLGEVDGCTQPIGMTTVQRMITSGIVIPALLGKKGEVLNLGRRQYPFSRAQRIALAERDGGCALCGAPPAWCEAHHIIYWSRGGRTDISNCALLCSHCHHVIHDQGWQIRATDTEIWFIPPASVDASRTPRQGGRARFGTPRPWNTTGTGENHGDGEPCAPPEPS